MVKHLSGDYNENLCYAVIFAISSLEKDIKQHKPHPLPDIDTDGFGYGKVVYLTNSRMHRNKQIAIILPDTLQSIGLQSMLIDYFPPVEISHYPTFEAFSTSGNDTFDYYFTNAALFVLYADFFLPRRSKTMVLIDGTEGEGGLSATSISRSRPRRKSSSSSWNNFLPEKTTVFPATTTRNCPPAKRTSSN